MGESEDIYKKIFDCTKDAIVLSDPEKGYIDCNPAALKIFGVTSKEIFRTLNPLVLSPEYQFDHLLSSERIKLETAKAIESGEHLFEWQYKSLDGHEFTATVLTTPIELDGRTVLHSSIRDICTRARTEGALHIREKEFKTVVGALNTGVVVHDRETRILISNHKANDILGLTAEQLRGMEAVDLALEFVFEDLSPVAVEDYPVMKVLATKKTLNNYVLGIKRADRDYITWVDVNAIPLLTESGELDNIVVNFVDITERKQVIEELQVSQRYNRTLFETSTIGLALCKMDGTLIDVNQAYADIIGYSIKEALQLTYWEVTPIEYEKQETVQLELLQSTGRYGPYEKEYLHKNGTLIPVRLRGALIKLEGENCIWSSVEDISERKQAENDLRESEERFRALHNASFGGIAIHDKGVILECNQGLSDITGYTTDELIGMDGLSLISDDTRDAVIHNIKSGYEKPYEAIGIRKNGERYSLRLEARNIPYKGRNVRVVEFRDITERVKFEKMMVQSEKMSSIAGLAAGLAHEINNPLAIIMQGYQNTCNRISPDSSKNREVAEKFNLNLNDMYDYLLDRKVITFIDAGRAAGERAAQIVKNMLLFSRNSDSTSRAVNIAELVDYTIELGSADYDLKKRYDFKFVDIIREYEPDLPEVVCCPSELEQVLLNLFKNSLQAMEEINREDHRPQFHLRLIKETDYVRIEIEDNGPGIPDSVKTRIFEPFFTTKPVGTGTGLGLSVSYMIITQNHRGTFEVESEVGKGAKFIVRLPL